MTWSVNFIDQSQKSEIVKFSFGVRYPKKEHNHVMSKKVKRHHSKVPKCNLVRNVRDMSLDFALEKCKIPHFNPWTISFRPPEVKFCCRYHTFWKKPVSLFHASAFIKLVKTYYWPVFLIYSSFFPTRPNWNWQIIWEKWVNKDEIWRAWTLILMN